MTEMYPATDVKPSDCFQKLCQVMISEGLSRQRIEDFRVILHMIMLECSRANIETGKTWVFEHVHSATQTFAFMEYFLSLAKSRSGKEERLYLIYLVNDLLYHAARKQMTWMRDAMLPLLVPLLKLAYEAAETDDQRAKVIKCITFWGDRDIFDHETLIQMKQSVTGPTLFPPLSIPQAPYTPPSQPLPIKIQMIPPSRPYFELPAGIMASMQCDEYYKPIDPSAIKVPFPRPPPCPELLAAIDVFYSGLTLFMQDDPVFDDTAPMDPQGWEKGYLDKFYERMASRKKKAVAAPPPQQQQQQQQNSSYSRSRSRSRSRSYSSYSSRSSRSSRSPSPVYHGRHRSPSRDRYKRNQSRDRYRSPSRERRRSPSRDRYRSSSRDRYRSPSRERYLSRDHHSKNRPSPPSNVRRYRSPSPSPSPLPIPIYPSSSSGLNTNTKHLGLGNQTADEYAAFRKNKSQSYSRREPPPPLICYKCGKPGHLARECDSL
ncbi:hypothetical protein G6F37_008863 [Rhizopus arrhizus]|nr:hypothetical protein G6F38_007390 [Rhizopus arrhizus]KAG1155081.1 hypothetical protein G6F37_008863 [Rhizopus arrhizus]